MTEAICRVCSAALRIGSTEHGPRYFNADARADGVYVQMGRGMWQVLPDGSEIKPGQWAVHESASKGRAIRFALHDDVCGKPEVAPSQLRGETTRDTRGPRRTIRGLGGE